jgi:hypothetical protein
MNGEFHFEANSFEFFIEIFVGTDSIGFLFRIVGQIKLFRIWFYGSTCNKINSPWNGSATHRLLIFRIPKIVTVIFVKSGFRAKPLFS